MLRDDRNHPCLLGSPAPVVVVTTHFRKVILEVGHMTTPPKQASEGLQRVLTRHHDGRGLQNEVQGDVPLVL